MLKDECRHGIPNFAAAAPSAVLASSLRYPDCGAPSIICHGSDTRNYTE
jgi:hypothetical protein